MKLFHALTRSTRPARRPVEAGGDVWSPALTLPAQAHQLRRTA
jgi:hypothetical protein